ncbi:MAG: SCO1664 family protein [Actinomycetota bacterium]
MTGPDDEVLRVLTDGDLEILGLLPRASNYTFLAKVSGVGPETLAVYKPRAGEAPLWDFPDGTLCRREVAAYLVARALGWPSVPPTVLRRGPEGPGSVQLFVDFDPRQHYFTLMQGRADEFRRVALFDAVVNNADRKSGHCLLAADGRVFVVDHGVCFSTAPKLRTVIWDFAGEAIPRPLTDDLRRLAEELRTGPLRDELSELLEVTEVDAAARRSAALIEAGRFPEPGPDRPYPWPAV